MATAPKNPPKNQSKNRSSALAKASLEGVVRGTFRAGAEIEEALRKAQERFHLISPATTASDLPEGVAVAFSAVVVDPQDTYKLSGRDDEPAKYGLGKVALDQVAAAAGVMWDPAQSRRLDDGSHPHFVHFRAVGHVRQFDGSLRSITGEKVVDMREGSPSIDDLAYQRARKLCRDRKQRMPARGTSALRELLAEARELAENQVREVRMHILGHAETKAKNRAIRSLGLRTSYTEAELAKPFVVARPVYTGHSEDPEIRKANAARIADSFLGASAALYGPPALPPPPAPASSPAGAPPPPVGTALDDDEGEADFDVDPETGEVTERQSDEDGPRFRFGDCKGTLMSEGSDEDLEWYAGVLRRAVENPKSAEFAERDKRELQITEDEIARRAMGG